MKDHPSEAPRSATETAGPASGVLPEAGARSGSVQNIRRSVGKRRWFRVTRLEKDRGRGRPKFLRLIDIAALMGVSKQRADQLRHDPSFPLSAAQYGRGLLWLTSEVLVWLQQHPTGTARWGARRRAMR